MKINLEECLEKKKIRTLKKEWPLFCNKKRYFKPKNIHEIKELYEADRFPTEIKIDGITHYFTSEIRQKFWRLIKIIYRHPAIYENISYNTVYKIIFSSLQTSINSGQNKIPLEAISDGLSKSLGHHEYYFLLSGLKFKDFNHLQFDEVMIFNFEEFNLNKIFESQTLAPEENGFDEEIYEFVSEKFFGKTCIKVSSVGDEEKSEQKARNKTRLILNYFRFLFCVSFYERVHENMIKISIKSESFSQKDDYFYQSGIDGIVTLACGLGRANLQDFELSEQFWEDNKDNVFFDDFSYFAFKDDKTEIESVITTAIYWIGEAQNDFDKESSFVITYPLNANLKKITEKLSEVIS